MTDHTRTAFGLCAWCARQVRVKKNGRLIAHDHLFTGQRCDGIDEMPETRPERMALKQAILDHRHRPEAHPFCSICSAGKPITEWVPWPCPVREAAEQEWKATVPVKTGQQAP